MNSTFDQFRVALADRYHIEREIGAGAMAIVYLADDLKHDRQVAMKMLRGEVATAVGRERFHREITILAGLAHPHVLPLYDSGEAGGAFFFVMPFVEGGSLRERIVREVRLPIADAVRITREVAAGLGYAHRRGVIHRDVKPENIMFQDDVALIADFGIGKRAQAPPDQEHLTREGWLIGTPAYMSPEQGTGSSSVDGRSDQYSLATVAYEMLAGVPPFPAKSVTAMLAKRLTETPNDLATLRSGIPPGVRRAIQRALARDSQDRFETMAEFAGALSAGIATFGSLIHEPTKRVQAAERSIAVLPFRNVSAEPDNEYFSDGITEEIINALARLDTLRVAGRTSAFSFKGSTDDLQAIGDKLHVQTILEGSVRKAGPRVRITARLINVADGYNLWADRFDREMHDIFAVQDEIATTIANQLQVALGNRYGGTDGGPLVREGTKRPEAYEQYLQGRFHLTQRGSALRLGLACFENALGFDPDYALAHAGVADALALLGFYGFLTWDDVMPRAKMAALRALDLDGELAEGHTAFGLVQILYEWNWEGARQSFETAMAITPDALQPRCWYALFYLASTRGRFDEAIRHAEIAVEADPLSSYTRTVYGVILALSRRYDDAIVQLRTALAHDDTAFLARRSMASVQRWSGNPSAAVDTLEPVLDAAGRHQWLLVELLIAYAHTGRGEQAQALRDELAERAGREHVQATTLAMASASCGEDDDAAVLLERALGDRDPMLVMVKIWPDFARLRAGDRWQTIADGMGWQ